MAFHRADARECRATFAAGIKVSALETDAFQREIVAAGFVRNTKILAGLTPFDSVGRDLTATRAMLRKKVSKFMTQGALDF